MAQKMLTDPAEMLESAPLVAPGNNHTTITEKIATPVLTPGFRKGWVLGFLIAFGLLNVFVISVCYLILKGVGIWGINIPVAWGIDIVNFVWWIGIGHAGTLISAILLLLRQKWRTSINRSAEAMTLFAVACAGMFPILHLGRPWYFFWLIPYPNTNWMWPNFRSPLMWDVFAVSTYASVSVLFWYIGLIPDVAALRDRAKNVFVRTCYGVLALGWRGSARHWHRYEVAYLLLGGLATPLVLSVHTVVSFDFAVAQLPGWHTTIFPPYFVAGAIYSGFAMVLTLAIPMRKVFKWEDFLTMRHMNNMSKVMLTTGMMVAYGYLIEGFTGWYSGSDFDRYMAWNRFVGPYAASYWALILCNIVIPQALWFAKVRANLVWVWLISIVINVGMWLERFIIIITSLHRDFVPSSWGMYYPTFWDWSLYAGTLGLFFTLMFIFWRVLPAISMAEVRGVWEEQQHKEHGGAHA